jgi:hypothetical protein
MVASIIEQVLALGATAWSFISVELLLLVAVLVAALRDGRITRQESRRLLRRVKALLEVKDTPTTVPRKRRDKENP